MCVLFAAMAVMRLVDDLRQDDMMVVAENASSSSREIYAVIL